MRWLIGAGVCFLCGGVGITRESLTVVDLAPVIICLVLGGLCICKFITGWKNKAKQQRSRQTTDIINKNTSFCNDAPDQSFQSLCANPSAPDHKQGDFIFCEHTVYRADGKELSDEDINYLRETGYERALERYESSSNPKFHRSEQEKQLSEAFYCKYAEQIRAAEHEMMLPDLYSFDSIDAAIDHMQRVLITAQALQEFCSKSPGGRLYFEDMWLHCHSSKNPDFSFIDVIKNRYLDLMKNYEVRKHDFEVHQKRRSFQKNADNEVWKVIEQNQGVLQKDLHKFFDPDLKPTIGTAVSHLVKANRISRVKHGNTFELTVIK